MSEPIVALTKAECAAVHDMIDMRPGCNPENVFAWDGSDDMSDPGTSAFVKIDKAAGRSVPDNCQ
jgi:hypothetical protein